MTTIAYARGTMACDSAWGDTNDACQTLLTKVFRLSSGAVIGESGDNDSRHVRLLLDKVKTFDKMPLAPELAALKVEMTALIAFPNGEVAMLNIDYDKTRNDWTAGVWKVNRGYASCGSGGQFALGMLGAKRSAREAVEFACLHDPYSRGPVHTMVVRQPRAKPKANRKATR